MTGGGCVCVLGLYLLLGLGSVYLWAHHWKDPSRVSCEELLLRPWEPPVEMEIPPPSHAGGLHHPPGLPCGPMNS